MINLETSFGEKVLTHNVSLRAMIFHVMLLSTMLWANLHGRWNNSLQKFEYGWPFTFVTSLEPYFRGEGSVWNHQRCFFNFASAAIIFILLGTNFLLQNSGKEAGMQKQKKSVKAQLIVFLVIMATLMTLNLIEFGHITKRGITIEAYGWPFLYWAKYKSWGDTIHPSSRQLSGYLIGNGKNLSYNIFFALIIVFSVPVLSELIRNKLLTPNVYGVCGGQTNPVWSKKSSKPESQITEDSAQEGPINSSEVRDQE